jgi:hypothetical protein
VSFEPGASASPVFAGLRGQRSLAPICPECLQVAAPLECARTAGTVDLPAHCQHEWAGRDVQLCWTCLHQQCTRTLDLPIISRVPFAGKLALRQETNQLGHRPKWQRTSFGRQSPDAPGGISKSLFLKKARLNPRPRLSPWKVPGVPEGTSFWLQPFLEKGWSRGLYP